MLSVLRRFPRFQLESGNFSRVRRRNPFYLQMICKSFNAFSFSTKTYATQRSKEPDLEIRRYWRVTKLAIFNKQLRIEDLKYINLLMRCVADLVPALDASESAWNYKTTRLGFREKKRKIFSQGHMTVHQLIYDFQVQKSVKGEMNFCKYEFSQTMFQIRLQWKWKVCNYF